MKKLLLSLLAGVSFSGCTPAVAEYDLQTEDYFTNGSMGCMMMRECTKDVVEVKSINDIEDYQNQDHSLIANEFNDVLKAMNDVGVNVYVAPQYYFLIGTRGVYYTKGNNVFLSADMTKRSSSLLSTLRHEGWHAVQDCMAGDINNSLIAIVHPLDKVPKYMQMMTENAYEDNPGVLWEKEAKWMGHTEGGTLKALKACKTGKMWEIYEPTPMTRQFLVEKGYIKE
jgi:hypothetical protein